MSADRKWMLVPALLALVMLLGCRFGQVAQGRVVAYDQAKGLVTLVQESAAPQPGKAKYALPPVTIKVPVDPVEMGPAPQPGRLLLFDTQQKQIVVFDAKSETLNTIAYTPVSEQSGVFGDDPRVARTTFPIVDREKKTITLYSAPERKLVTFTVAGEYLALPDDTWRAGDEVRYYYKQPGQALRMMNVTKTEVRKGG